MTGNENLPVIDGVISLGELIKSYDVRAVVPDPFSPRVAKAIGAAFATVIVLPQAGESGDQTPASTDHEPTSALARPRVVIGHDMRESGPELVAAFASGLTEAGVDVINIGLCSTDGLYYASGALNIPGAMFTASHNPAKYNGIKLCRKGAAPVGQDSGLARIRELAEQYLTFDLPGAATQLGQVTERDMLNDYAAFLRSLVDVSQIKPIKIVVDAGNGMAGLTVPAVLGTAVGLAELPIEVVPLYFELDGNFPNHEANPLDPKNLVDLQKAVVAHGADLGLAFDGDADRCFVIDEKGEPISPSAITVLVGLRHIESERAAGRQATIIHNLITSAAVPDLLQAAGAKTVRTRVGHSFIKAQMAENNAVFGGEHSAHYYFRDFYFADTGMLAALHVISQFGSQEHPLSELASMYEPYYASGEINSEVSDIPAAIERVVSEYVTSQGLGPVEVDHLDGITISGWQESPRWWFNIRASNTEPLLRLNVEAQDEDILEKLTTDVLGLIRAS